MEKPDSVVRGKEQQEIARHRHIRDKSVHRQARLKTVRIRALYGIVVPSTP